MLRGARSLLGALLDVAAELLAVALDLARGLRRLVTSRLGRRLDLVGRGLELALGARLAGGLLALGAVGVGLVKVLLGRVVLVGVVDGVLDLFEVVVVDNCTGGK